MNQTHYKFNPRYNLASQTAPKVFVNAHIPYILKKESASSNTTPTSLISIVVLLKY